MRQCHLVVSPEGQLWQPAGLPPVLYVPTGQSVCSIRDNTLRTHADSAPVARAGEALLDGPGSREPGLKTLWAGQLGAGRQRDITTRA